MLGTSKLAWRPAQNGLVRRAFSGSGSGRPRFFLLELSLNQTKAASEARLFQEAVADFRAQLSDLVRKGQVVFGSLKASQEPVVLFECPDQRLPFDTLMEVS